MMDYDEIYKCCRWCHWFDSDRCNHPKTFTVEDRSDFADEIYMTWDNGNTAEAIKEMLDPERLMKTISDELKDTKLSKKAQSAILEPIQENLEVKLTDDIIPDIDAAVRDMYISCFSKNAPAAECAPEVVDPESMWCRYYE